VFGGAALLSGCGAEAPPAQTARAARGNAAAARHAEGASSASLSDSALEPAAKEAIDAEDWSRAESLYRELARRQPRNPAGKRGLGVALIKQGKNDEAVEVLQGSLELADDACARLDLATAFAGLGRYPSALPHLRRAVKLQPTDPAGWSQLADALVKVEKPEGAAEVLNESREACHRCAADSGWGSVADEVAEALDAKAEKQLAGKDAVGARKSVDAAAALRPDLPALHLTQAKLARADGDATLAKSELRKAIEGMPDAKTAPGTYARLELATLLIADGGGAEAAKLAREVVAARGDHPGALDALGRACDATKDVPCARQAYEKVANLPPTAELSEDALDHARLRMKELKGGKHRGRRTDRRHPHRRRGAART